MNSKGALVLSLTAVLALAGAALVPAEEAPAALGTWNVVANTPEGSMPVVVTVRTVEGQLKVEAEIDGALQAVSDEKIDGASVSFKVTYGFGVYEVSAKVDGDTIEGTWQGGGYSGALKGTRRP